MMNFRLFNSVDKNESQHNLPKDYVNTLFCQRAKDLPLYVTTNLLV
ncbi:MAG: hypothetical protein J1E81_03140 [Eubacterium sp.]|nr:hypothetical protein [Eubacterium sp.]